MKHSELVKNLKKDKQLIAIQMLQQPDKVDALHMAVGISGEAGELLDCVKKFAIYNQPIDKDNLIEELGDLEFYMEGLRQIFRIKRARTIRMNIAKLTARYGLNYSDKSAQERKDKVNA